jgi:hypothetical protein
LFDYYKLKLYLKELELKMKGTREFLEREKTEILKLRSNVLNEVVSTQLDKMASSQHHLLSTKSIPGVLKKNGGISTSCVLTEEHLKKSTKLLEHLKTIGQNRSKIVVKPVRNYIGKDDMEKKFQGPFLVRKIDIAKIYAHKKTTTTSETNAKSRNRF